MTVAAPTRAYTHMSNLLYYELYWGGEETTLPTARRRRQALRQAKSEAHPATEFCI